MRAAAILASFVVLFAAGASRALGSSEAAAERECIAAGLVRPQVIHSIEMHHAGIRPGTPRLWHSQGTSGWFQVSPLPEGCTASIVRAVVGQVQMQKRTDRGVWINVGAKHGNIDWKGSEFFELFYGPNHAWPDYRFNECVGSQGWLKVRGILVVKVKDASSRQVISERRFTFSAKVHGSCKLARYSKKVTAHYKEEWGGS